MNAFNFLNDTSPDFKIGVAGDWHGDLAWALHAIEKFHEAGVKYIFHLGDFCIWGGPTGMKYTRRINKELEALGMILLVTLGNHENYNLVESHYTPDDLGLLKKSGEDHIALFPRGFQWNWHGTSYMSFGGANSIDKIFRKPGKSWWEQEQITDEQIFQWEVMPKVDVLFSHDSPWGVDMLKSHRDTSNGWNPEQVKYSNASRHQLRRLTDIIQPSLIMHGHYHKFLDTETLVEVNEVHDSRSLTEDDLRGREGRDSEYVLRSICLDKEYSNMNMGIFDPMTVEFSILSTWGS